MSEQARVEINGRRTPAEMAAEERQKASRQQSTLAKALAWFSLGLGAAEAAVPGLITRVVGIRNDVDNREVVRAAGMREIASGVGLLARKRRVGWLRARLAGDVMDLALLGSAFRSRQGRTRQLAIATGAVAGVMVLDYIGSRRLTA